MTLDLPLTPQPGVQAGGLGGKNLGGNDSSVIRILSAAYLFDTHLAREMIKLALQMKAWWRKRWRKFSPRKKAVANIVEGNDSRKQKRRCLRWREVQQGGIFMLNRNLLEKQICEHHWYYLWNWVKLDDYLYLRKICRKTFHLDIFQLSVLEIMKCSDSFKITCILKWHLI